MKRVILFRPSVETLSFFSNRIAEVLLTLGYEVLIVCIREPFLGTDKLRAFIRPGETVMITFNFHGIQQEAIFYTEDGRLLFDVLDVSCINIIVDHPYYYYEELKHLPRRYSQICIDEDHADYMKRFYSHIHLLRTLPIAGSCAMDTFALEDTADSPSCVLEPRLLDIKRRAIPLSSIPLQNRSTDVVFVGCYTDPSFFVPYMKRNGKEYEDFYQGILDDLLAEPDQCSHTVFLRHLNRELPDLSDENIRKVMSKMIFLDLWIRFTFRGRVLQTLLDNDIRVHCIGSGFEALPLAKKENLTQTGYSKTATCLKALADSKLSINVMPWFKRGSHDRIHSSMLNGAVCVTDKSQYLTRKPTLKQALCYYDLKNLKALPMQVQELLSNPSLMEEKSHKGYLLAKSAFSFDTFVRQLVPYFDEI